MILQDYKIEGDYIKVSKAELEEWKHHYWQIFRVQDEDWEMGFYLGKGDAFVELLKMFEQED